MAVAIQTADLRPNQLDAVQQHWVYNGLDCAVTSEIHNVLARQHTEYSSLIYGFEKAMQAPALEMTLRGFRIDLPERAARIAELEEKKDRLVHVLNKFGRDVFYYPPDKNGNFLNANSPHQLKHLFYSVMGLPEQYKIDKGEKKLSTNREALEKLQAYFYARPLCSTILALRDVVKKLGVLHTGSDPDGRMRFGYSVAGTETGRWASSGNAFGTGTNGQNITEELRSIFVADPGKRLCYIDLEQAESRLVGLLIWWIFKDPTYLDACESGDLHTTVCKMVWPGLGWTGDKKADKAIAEQPFYRQYSYRDMSKRGGHGSNYYGQPQTMAMHLKVAKDLMVNFQRSYFGEFPYIPKWHQWTAFQLQTKGKLITPLGRERYFMGRLTDDSTLREAIAFVPQGTIGDMMNLGLWRLWKTYGKEIDLLAQVHDAVVFQYPEHLHHKIPTYAQTLITPLTIHGREIKIPVEAMTGFNWGKEVTEKDQEKYTKAGRKPPRLNRDGLRKYATDDNRTRRNDPRASLLDRRVL